MYCVCKCNACVYVRPCYDIYQTNPAFLVLPPKCVQYQAPYYSGTKLSFLAKALCVTKTFYHHFQNITPFMSIAYYYNYNHHFDTFMIAQLKSKAYMITSVLEETKIVSSHEMTPNKRFFVNICCCQSKILFFSFKRCMDEIFLHFTRSTLYHL